MANRSKWSTDGTEGVFKRFKRGFDRWQLLLIVQWVIVMALLIGLYFKD